jgi:glycine C-acetyltransferase/8-amino-7-oxononanoate synthase
MATGDSTTQVLPLVVGAADDAVRVCERALEKGIFAQAIRPPTVPEGSSRLRLAVMASHTRTELQDAAAVLAAAMRSVVGDRPKPISVEAMREPDRSRIFDGLAEAA